MGFISLFADKIIFQPPKSSYKDDISVIKIETTKNQKISANYFKNPDSEYTILFSHGNAEDIGLAQTFFEELYESGFSVLAYDYRGYGTSDGNPSEENAYEDAESAYRYLTESLNVPAEKIIIHGRSLGGAVSIDLASKQKCGGLIVESSFVSAFRVMTGYKIFPFDKFESISKIKDVNCPILFIHGKKDTLIPFWHTEKLLEEAKSKTHTFWIEDAGHNDVFLKAQDDYLKAIKDFSQKLTK